jgi:hypothetical protein
LIKVIQFKDWCHGNHSALNKQQCIANDKGNQMRSHIAQLDDLYSLPGLLKIIHILVAYWSEAGNF